MSCRCGQDSRAPDGQPVDAPEVSPPLARFVWFVLSFPHRLDSVAFWNREWELWPIRFRTKGSAMKKYLASLLLLPALNGLELRAASLDSPVILSDDRDQTNRAYRLVWPTQPGLRYGVQQSFNLSQWTTLPGFPVQASGLAGQYPFTANTNRTFFRVFHVDEQPPLIVARSPENGSFAVRRSARILVRFEDASAIDPALIQLKVGALGTFATNDARLSFSQGTLAWQTGTNAALGAYGETVDVSLVLADVLGNRATNNWSFTLEIEPKVVSNLVVFGSPQAQVAGQQVGSGPTTALASRSGAPVRISSRNLKTNSR